MVICIINLVATLHTACESVYWWRCGRSCHSGLGTL